VRTRAHRHIRATVRVRLVCSPLRLCRLTYFLAGRRLWLCSTCYVQFHGHTVAGKSGRLLNRSARDCQVWINLCNGKLRMLCDEQLHVYRSDLTTGMLAPAVPLLFRCCTILPLLLKDVGGSSARADGQPAQPGAAAASRCLGGWRRSRLRQRTISLSQKPSAHVQQDVVRVDRVQLISTPVDPRDVRYKRLCYFTLTCRCEYQA
jgi:hypothetical protein